MKLLHVVAGMNPKQGGVCQAIRTIVAGMEGLAVHNEVVCLDADNASYLSKDSFVIHAIGTGKGPWSYSSKLIPWLIGNLHHFDVVILHGLWLFPGFAVRKAFRQLVNSNNKTDKIPKLFIMPHGMLDPYFQQAPERKLKALRNWLYWKLIESKVVNHAEGLLFTCEEERRLAQKSFKPYNPKQEVVIGLGVEAPPSFTPIMREAFLEKCPSLRNRPYLLFLSRIHDKKGVDLLIEAYNRILVNNSKTEFAIAAESPKEGKFYVENYSNELPVLVIAGPGLDTPFGKRVQNLAFKSKALGGSVLFPGMLSGNMKWGAFYGCDAFVLPSHQENFGLAIVEALACGKPVLITNQVNIWREIEATNSGMVEDDTLIGTQKLLESWIKLTEREKLDFNNGALMAYQQHFVIKNVIKKMVSYFEKKAYSKGDLRI